MIMSDTNQPENDIFWKTSMKTLKVRKMIIDIEKRLPGLIDEWYQERGLDTPPWRQPKPYFDKDGNIIRPEGEDGL